MSCRKMSKMKKNVNLLTGVHSFLHFLHCPSKSVSYSSEIYWTVWNNEILFIFLVYKRFWLKNILILQISLCPRSMYLWVISPGRTSILCVNSTKNISYLNAISDFTQHGKLLIKYWLVSWGPALFSPCWTSLKCSCKNHG